MPLHSGQLQLPNALQEWPHAEHITIIQIGNDKTWLTVCKEWAKLVHRMNLYKCCLVVRNSAFEKNNQMHMYKIGGIWQ